MTIPPVESWARVGGLHYIYAEVGESGYVEYLSTSAEIQSIGDVEYDERLEVLKPKKMIAGLQAIVFTGMCFEAAIYDFASIHLGDKYVQEHLDKLDVLSKWVIVLRFVSGFELRKGEAPYGALKNLIVARNRLVHAKSEEFDFSNQQKQIERMLDRGRSHDADVHNAIRALVLMSLELDRSQDGHHNPLPSYSKQNAPFRQFFTLN